MNINNKRLLTGLTIGACTLIAAMPALATPPTPTNAPRTVGSAYKAENILYTIEWDTNSAPNFELYSSTTDSNYNKVISTSAGSHLDSSSKGYRYYKYKACNGNDCSGLSANYLRLYVYGPPNPPGGLMATTPSQLGQNVTLTWNWASGIINSGAKYKVKQTNPDNTIVESETPQLPNAAQTSITVTPSQYGVTQYAVRGCNPNDVCGNDSNITVNIAQPPPPAPDNLTKAPQLPIGYGNSSSTYQPANRDILVTWDRVTNGNYYELLVNNSPVYWGQGNSAVVRFNQYGNSIKYIACNNEQRHSCTTASPSKSLYAYGTPVAPPHLSASPNSVEPNTNVNLSWTWAGGIIDQNAYYKVSSIAPDGTVKPTQFVSQLSGQATTSTDVTPTIAGTWRFDVQACNPDGNIHGETFCGPASSTNVSATHPIVVNEFKWKETSVLPGQTATLKWDVSNAIQCTDNYGEIIGVKGSRQFTYYKKTIYSPTAWSCIDANSNKTTLSGAHLTVEGQGNILGAYNGVETYKTSPGTNVTTLVSEVIESRANTYLYALSNGSRSHWDNFGPFLTALAKATDGENIKVWLSITLPRPTGEGGSAPSFGDLQEWVAKLITLKKSHSNLVGLSIDDFDNYIMAYLLKNCLVDVATNDNCWQLVTSSTQLSLKNGVNDSVGTFMTPSYIKNVMAPLREADLSFMPTIYGRKKVLLDFIADKYQESFDAILFPYLFKNPEHQPQANQPGTYTPFENVYDTQWLDDNIKLFLEPWDSSIAKIVDIYATTYDTSIDPSVGERFFNVKYSEPEYVLEVAEQARKLTDGMVVYRMLNQVTKQTDYGAESSPYEFKNEGHERKKLMFAHRFKQWQQNLQNGSSHVKMTSIINARTSSTTIKNADPFELVMDETQSTFTPFMYTGRWWDNTWQNNPTDICSTSEFTLSGNFVNTDNIDEILNIRSNHVDVLQKNTDDNMSFNNPIHTSLATNYNGGLKFASAFKFGSANADEVLLFQDVSASNSNLGVSALRVASNKSVSTIGLSISTYGSQALKSERVEAVLSGKFANSAASDDDVAILYRKANGNLQVRRFAYNGSSTLIEQPPLYDDAIPSLAFAVKGNFTSASREQIALFYVEGGLLRISLIGGSGSEMSLINADNAAKYWYSFETAYANSRLVSLALGTNAIKHVTVGDFDADGEDEFALYVSYNQANTNLPYFKVFMIDRDFSARECVVTGDPNTTELSACNPKGVNSNDLDPTKSQRFYHRKWTHTPWSQNMPGSGLLTDFSELAWEMSDPGDAIPKHVVSGNFFNEDKSDRLSNLNIPRSEMAQFCSQ
jgi:hypothetical protein